MGVIFNIERARGESREKSSAQNSQHKADYSNSIPNVSGIAWSVDVVSFCDPVFDNE